MSENASQITALECSSRKPAGRYRWLICGLLFYATTVNYVDRSVFGVLNERIKQDIPWTLEQFGYINSLFALAYAIGFLLSSKYLDLLGTRVYYVISMVIWALAAASHSMVHGLVGLCVARFILGLGESGNFPCAIKTTAEWFPKKERATATGLFNAGSNVGAILAPLMAPWIAQKYSWRVAFLMTGFLEALWIVSWLIMYHKPTEHPKISKEELDYILSDQPEPPVKVKWGVLIRYSQTWAFSIGKFLTDGVWWFYLFWFPVFMQKKFGVDWKHIGWPMITAYIMADVGSIVGGHISSMLLDRGWSANWARKTAMALCICCILPVVIAPHLPIDGKWFAVLLLGSAMAGHQGFSANLFTFTSDLFPRKAVGSVVSMGGFCGAMGGFVLQIFVGKMLSKYDNFSFIFVCLAMAYVVSAIVIHILAPKMEPAKLELETA
jgi:MFS transporter, ACS family, hexuronate transporter